MLAIVRGEEGLAVATRAAVVYVQDNIAVIDQVLRGRAIRHASLSSWPAMDLAQCRKLALRTGSVWLVENRGNLQAIERLKANEA